MQDDDAMMQEAQEMLRQLVQVRLQAGPEQFKTVASQLGLPPEVLEIVEQAAAQVEGPPQAPASPLSNLVSASGQPLSTAGQSSGLLMPDGSVYRPAAPSADSGGGNGALAADQSVSADDEDEVAGLLDEDDQVEQAQAMFQELLGVRLVIGQDNFLTLVERMGMSADASSAIQQAAADIEQQIEERYPNEDEGNTVRLLNARMMMGEERFSDLAEQVGMPQEMRDSLEDIAGQIESAAGGDEEDDEEPELQA
jgi:hypothetical protein